MLPGRPRAHRTATPRRRSRTLVPALVPAAVPAVVAVLALAGCASGAAGTGPGAAPTAATSTGATDAGTPSAAAFPVTVDNCGTEVTLDAAPERLVTIKSSTTELVVALGLADRVVGAAFLDGPYPQDLADEAAAVPVVSDGVPGQEAVLALEPDLVLGGWESNFSADGAGERDALADLGIASYVAASACKGPAYQPDPLTFGTVFDEIRQVGAVLGVPDRAEALVEEQEAALAEVPALEPGTSALWYSSGSDTPYVGAGIGAPQMIMDAVGLENVFADVHDTWTSAGWEQVVAADPDVVVLVDAAWNTAESKIAALEANPATAALTAVRERRYVTVPFAATEGGVRNVEAAASIAQQLADLGVASGS
ncbi:putative F420-0 ABC transporter substrate-binding protein [Cellulomonas marina]|uniref:Iron complex transport system substrate-binding protein n=1 Tax=Cellulomonas marina TaxID=988821 RepID=A0A1I0VD54_9CELL|nr:putative F420-0 ABC transporter substrate-binding protein [Cellulomonas marina]GIG29171.1 ABC transporter substrate-binding protein [Cellulomonas marina]SFA73516.1 iron complex transport system substrate-binding protein [Cellulomonas marina]